MLSNKLVQWSQIVIAAYVIIIAFSEYILPLVTYQIYQDQFMRLSIECDQAMHNEMAIRDLSIRHAVPNKLVTSAAVELAVCHQYDKLRKKMLILGVSEERLSLLGLEALESERIPVSRMVEPHRMPRF